MEGVLGLELELVRVLVLVPGLGLVRVLELQVFQEHLGFREHLVDLEHRLSRLSHWYR